MLASLPKAQELLGDKGYDAGWFRQALADRGITACIPAAPIGARISSRITVACQDPIRPTLCSLVGAH